MPATATDDFREAIQADRATRVKTLFSFDAFDYQADLLNQSNPPIKAAVKPGRQVGKTEVGGAIAADGALRAKDVMILGPFEDTVSEMMEAARKHLLTAEEQYSEAGLTLGTEYRNKTDWKFNNGGRLRARTVGTDGTQIRGKNPEIVLVDEAAYIKDSIFTEVIEPFFSTHKEYEYYLFSTPAGKSGYFYEKVEQDDSFYSPHWPSRICPLISEEWLAEKRAELDSRTFQQEYLGQFADDGETLFSVDQITSIQGDTELGDTRYLGVDIAREGGDRTVYTEIDSEGAVRVADSEEKSTMDGVLGRIKDLHATHDYENIVVEENSMGGGVVDFSDIPELTPFSSTTKSKHKLYKQLERAIENESLTLPNHRRLLDELTSLTYDFTQHGYMRVHHPENGHDDFPDSLAFALWARENQRKVTYRNGNRSRSGTTRT